MFGSKKTIIRHVVRHAYIHITSILRYALEQYRSRILQHICLHNTTLPDKAALYTQLISMNIYIKTFVTCLQTVYKLNEFHITWPMLVTR